MKQQKSPASPPCAVKQTSLSRRDRASAALVQKCITLQQIHGTRYATEFLKEQKIDGETVMRVLLGMSEYRRHDDPVDSARFGRTDDITSP